MVIINMSQQLHVLKCYQCNTYQSDIVKKVAKWSCKLCGAKQSVKKVFLIGSGKDCRQAVQELNKRQFEEKDDEDVIIEQRNQSSLVVYEMNKSKPNSSGSKWDALIPEEIESVDEIESNYTFTRPEKTKKRKSDYISAKPQQDIETMLCDKENSPVSINKFKPSANLSVGNPNKRNKWDELVNENENAQEVAADNIYVFTDRNVDLDDVLNL